MADELYCDGGVIGHNPSDEGGTYAWVLVRDGKIVRQASGIILPSDGYNGVISNNVSELVAAVVAIEAMPIGWTGTLYSDSQVTLGRLFLAWPLRNVPRYLVTRLWAIQRTERLAGVQHVLLQGHPTKADLAAGIGKKRNLPVSKWNAWADRECAHQASEYMIAKHLLVEVGGNP